MIKANDPVGVTSLLVILLIFLLAICSIPVKAGTYEGSSRYEEEIYGMWVTKGELKVVYSAPDSAEVHDLIPVTVTIECMHAPEYVELLGTHIGLRLEEDISKGWKWNICTDSHFPETKLYVGDKYNHTFYMEAPEQGKYYVVLCWADKWSDGSEFTLDVGDEDPEGVSSNMSITIRLPGDTDGDGVYDSYESRMGLDPLSSDTDGDGIPDGEEDADGDGLKNGDECGKYFTDPTKADTDGDGWNDSEEISRGISDPRKFDSDGDGWNDQADCLPTNPLVPNVYALGGIMLGATLGAYFGGKKGLYWRIVAILWGVLLGALIPLYLSGAITELLGLGP